MSDEISDEKRERERQRDLSGNGGETIIADVERCQTCEISDGLRKLRQLIVRQSEFLSNTLAIIDEKFMAFFLPEGARG